MLRFSFPMFRSTKQPGKTNHPDLFSLLIAGPESKSRILKETDTTSADLLCDFFLISKKMDHLADVYR